MYNFDEFPETNRNNFVRYNPVFIKSIFGNNNVLPFWVADTDFQVMPPLIEALQKRAQKGLFGYETKSPDLKQSITNWYKNRYGIKINGRKLLFTPSVNTSIAAIIDEFTKEGEGVIIQPPVYQAFQSTINDLDRKTIYNPLILKDNHYEIDFEDLSVKAADSAAKIMLLCSPHNPIGRVWQEEELKEIARICTEHNLLLIADEIHGDIIYPPHNYISMINIMLPLSNNMIMVSSPGKTFGMPGLVDSFIFTVNNAHHKALHKRLEKFHLDKSNAFANTAWQVVYENGNKWLDEMIGYLNNNVDYIVSFLATELPEVNMSRPEGTYQVWLDFRSLKLDNDALAKFLAHEAGIALNQGHTYGPGGGGFARMNIASPKHIIVKAMKQLKDAIETL